MNNFLKLNMSGVPLLEVETAVFLEYALHDFKQCGREKRNAALLESVARSNQWDGSIAFKQWLTDVPNAMFGHH